MIYPPTNTLIMTDDLKLSAIAQFNRHDIYIIIVYKYINT